MRLVALIRLAATQFARPFHPLTRTTPFALAQHTQHQPFRIQTMSSAAAALAEASVFPSAAAVADELLAQLRTASAEAIAARGSFHVALSGGSLPATLATALLSPAAAALDLSQWHWWFADERCVALGDKDSNFAEANSKLFSKLKNTIAADRMHAIDEALTDKPEQAASAYESAIRALVPDCALDVLLLGMGPDGHCCSLFPGHALLDEQQRLVAPIFDSPKPPPQRITMTFPLVNKARLSLFVVTGGGKADALSTVMQQRRSNAAPADAAFASFLPAARVRSQRVLFLADQDAAAKLDSKL